MNTQFFRYLLFSLIFYIRFDFYTATQDTMPIQVAFLKDKSELVKCVRLQRCVVLLNEATSSPQLTKTIASVKKNDGVIVNHLEDTDSVIALTAAENAPCFLIALEKIHKLAATKDSKFQLSNCATIPLDRVMMQCRAELKNTQGRCGADISIVDILESFSTRDEATANLKPICLECTKRRKEEEKQRRERNRERNREWAHHRALV